MAARWWLTAAIAVVALVAGIVAWTFLRDEVGVATGDTTTTAADTTAGDTATTVAGSTTTGGETTTSAASPTTAADGTTTTPAPFGQGTAEEAVLAWVDALAIGDSDTAWALMDAAAQEAFGGRAAFDALQADLAEGFGAWADAADRVGYVVGVAMTFQTEIEVVTLVGRVGQEGEPTDATVAVPAIRRGELGFQVLPFVRGEQVEFVSPPPLDPNDPDASPPVAVDGTIVVVVPDTASRVVISVDEEVVSSLEGDVLDPAREGAARATVPIDPPIDAGRHALTVVYLDDNVVHADAILFEAIG